MNTPFMLAVLYAGLAGIVLALIIATAQQKWSCKVFFLLALRLAIGWHFLFEGLYKVNSVYTGPTDTNRPFTSEPYFRAATGPLGPYMRQQFSDPADVIDKKVRAPKQLPPGQFAALTAADQAAACPPAVAQEFDAMLEKAEATAKAQAERALKAADEAPVKALKEANELEQRALNAKWTPAEVEKLKRKADDAREKAHNVAAGKRDEIRARLAAYGQLRDDFAAAFKDKPDAGMLAGQLDPILQALKAKADDELKAVTEAEEKAIKAVTEAEERALTGAWTEAEKEKIRAEALAARVRAVAGNLDAFGPFALTAQWRKTITDAEKARAEAQKQIDTFKEGGKELVAAAKAAYARWVYGVDARPAKVKFITGDVTMTGPERLAHLERLRQDFKDAKDRQAAGLGTGNGTDNKNVAGLRTDALNAEYDLAKDADAFVLELKKALNDDKAVEETPAESQGQKLDRITMWFLVGVGTCLLAGFLTRLACLAAAGFLVMTYLLHPPVPWNPLPPGTEGNPIFINKNVIECLALLSLACMPTGRWLGVDALLARLVFGPRKNEPAPPAA